MDAFRWLRLQEASIGISSGLLLMITFYHFICDVHGGTDSFVLQKDNFSPHRARFVATYLESEYVKRMNWPSQSPQMNLIENLCRLMKAKKLQRFVPPRNPLFLFDTPSNMWNSLSDSNFQSLVAFTPNRVEIVRKQPVRSTKY